MRTVIQRAKRATVKINNKTRSEIKDGLLILLGVGKEDTPDDAKILARKIAALRIFSDSNDKMNLSVKDVNAAALVVSNFTLYADAKKGTRPSYDGAMSGEKANELYEIFCTALKDQNVPVCTGEFGADMEIDLINDGPVTIVLTEEPEQLS